VIADQNGDSRKRNAVTEQALATPGAPGTLGPVRLDQHPAAVYLARLAARYAARARYDRLHQLRYQHTQAARYALADRYAPASINKALSALWGMLRECWWLGLVGADNYQRAADLVAVRGSTLPRGRALATSEVRALFTTCRRGYLGGRSKGRGPDCGPLGRRPG
jgi:hypothetical protein